MSASKTRRETVTSKAPHRGAVSARDPEVPTVGGSQRAFETFLPEALKIPESGVRPFRYDGSLAYHNLTTGLAALLPHEATLRVELPRTDLAALRALPELALAVIFANEQVDRGAAKSDGSTAKLMKAAFASRALLLDAATALASKGYLPKRAVEKIREGHGNIDAAADCVALSALFIKHAAGIKGRHPLAKSDIEGASEVGNALLKVLRPKRTRSKATPAAIADAANHRDRLWTLLVQRFEGPHGLERAAMHLWGRDAGAHVPPLLSFTPAPRTKAAPVAPPAP